MIPGENRPHEPGGDPLDELIRQAMKRGAPSVQPPQRIWERIRNQVTAGPAPTSHQPPTERLSRLLAPVVQGLAAAVLFVLVGVSLGSPRGIDPRQVETVSPPPAPTAAEPNARQASPVPVQRLGRLAAVDTFSYEQAPSQVQKSPPQSEHATRVNMVSADPDKDLVINSRYVPGGVFP